MAEWCYGFDKLAEHVRQFPPEWAAPITGLPAEQIREAARLMGTIRPMFIRMGNGIGDQTNDGTATDLGDLSDRRHHRQPRRSRRAVRGRRLGGSRRWSPGSMSCCRPA